MFKKSLKYDRHIFMIQFDRKLSFGILTTYFLKKIKSGAKDCKLVLGLIAIKQVFQHCHPLIRNVFFCQIIVA